MFTVQGYIDGVAYAVAAGPEAVEATDTDGERAGIVVGSPNAVGLLLSAVGDNHRPLPVTQALTLDLQDGASVLAALQALTEVTDVTGDDIPDLSGDEPVIPGVEY